jgi:ligand-binding SRPBCC domain-containing protein
MVSTSLKIDINRPLPTVYRFLMKLDNYLLWQAGLVNVEATNGLTVGSRIAFVSMGMGKRFTLKATVKRNDGHSSFTVVSNRGPLTFESTYHLQEETNGTRLQLITNIDPGVAFKLAESVLQSISDSRYEGDLQALKAILESEA